jgi:small subunit ribosomal protein S17
MANKNQEEVTETEGTLTETAAAAAEGTGETVETAPAEEALEAKADTPVPTDPPETPKQAAAAGTDSETPARKGERGNRAEKIGTVSSDKMTKTCVVRVDRLVKHPRYRRYVRRRTKFMAHNEMGATIGDRVRIVETRPLSAHKRWRVVEIIQKAAK